MLSRALACRGPRWDSPACAAWREAFVKLCGMPAGAPAATWWIPSLLALAGLSGPCARETRRPEPSPPAARIEVAALSAELSEPGGYFDTDNVISNETSYLQVADQLADAVPAGGVYVGVGPDQNFSYIARVRPRYAFILDIRRENLLQHLLFAALFARADDAVRLPVPALLAAVPGRRPRPLARRGAGAGRPAPTLRGGLRRQPARRVRAHRGAAGLRAGSGGPGPPPRHLPRVLRRAGRDPLPQLRPPR